MSGVPRSASRLLATAHTGNDDCNRHDDQETSREHRDVLERAKNLHTLNDTQPTGKAFTRNS